MLAKRLSDLYGKENGILVEYMDYLNDIAGIKSSSAYNYYMTLRSLAKFLKHRRKHMDCQPDEVEMVSVSIQEMTSITQEEWWDYLDYIQFGENESNNSFAVRLSIIRGFYEWLTETHGTDPVTCVAKTKSPQAKRKDFTVITGEMEEALCNSFEGDLTTRNICIIKMALHCGLGLTELCALDLEDVELNTVIVKEPDGRERRIPLNTEVTDAINAYIPERIPPIDGSNAFFVSAAKGRMHRGAIQKFLRKAARTAGSPVIGISLRDIHLTAKKRMIADNGLEKGMMLINVKSTRYCRRIFGKKPDAQSTCI